MPISLAQWMMCLQKTQRSYVSWSSVKEAQISVPGPCNGPLPGMAPLYPPNSLSRHFIDKELLVSQNLDT